MPGRCCRASSPNLGRTDRRNEAGGGHRTHLGDGPHNPRRPSPGRVRIRRAAGSAASDFHTGAVDSNAHGEAGPVATLGELAEAHVARHGDYPFLWFDDEWHTSGE